MKVFLSYGSAADQITALRLQTLAAVNRLSVVVPPAFTRESPAPVVESQVARRLGHSHVVLSLIASGLTEACRQETNTGFGIVQNLKAIEAEQNVKTALLALGTVALGLLIFAPQD